MNAHRKLTLVALIATVFTILTSSAGAQVLSEKMRVSFPQPIEVPGVVLPAGTYVFESLESEHLNRIMSADQMHVYAVVSTIPEERLTPSEKGTVQLGESSKGTPQKVSAWFLPGPSDGSEFIYDHSKSTEEVSTLSTVEH